MASTTAFKHRYFPLSHCLVWLSHAWRQVSRGRHSWAIRSFLLGGVGTIADLATVIVLVQLAHFDPVWAAPCGVAIGSLVNFALNRRLVFRDARGSRLAQLGRYALTFVAAMGIHAGMVFLLTHLLHVHYVISKLLADFVVFGVGNTAAMRYLVFRTTGRAQPPVTSHPHRA